MYILPCGALASEWFGLLTITLKVNVNKWASPIVHCKYNNWFTLSLINLEYSNRPNHFVFVVIIITYPILTCVEAPILLVGYIMGGTYSL